MGRSLRSRPPGRCALVLDSGGHLGAAWLLGALQAIWSETGWHPAHADVVLGTSAGALVGSLVAARHWPCPNPLSESVQASLRRAGALVREGPPSLAPGSWRLALRGTVGLRPAVIAAGLLPNGRFSTRPIQDFVRATLQDGWPASPDLRVVATDLETGRRRILARGGAGEVAAAVAASCAVPGFYRPVAIGGRRYVDGAVTTPSGLAVVRGLGVDTVVCLNPGAAALYGRGLLPRRRRRLHELLLRETAALAEEGVRVFVVEPDERLSRMIGLMPMSARRAAAVGHAAFLSVSDEFRSKVRADCRDALAGLRARGGAHLGA